MTAPAGLRAAAVLTAGVLVALAALHVVWLRSPWPLADRVAFRRTVLGRPEAIGDPGPAPTLVVTALLLAAAWIALARGAGAPWPFPAWMLRWGSRVAGGVLVLRGVAGLAQAFAVPRWTTPEFAFWSGRLYSPLALALGLALLLNRAR